MKSNEIVRKYKSRGYSGYCEINGKKYFCRSMVEFIYLNYLYKIYDESYTIEMEGKIFYCDDYSYKPDFLIYKNNKLIRIIETKYDKRQIIEENNENRYKVFTEYFKKLGIVYDIVYKKDIDWKKYEDIEIKLEEWKKLNVVDNILCGEMNPMFGRKHNENTKKLIGEKTVERYKDEEFMKKFKESTKKTDEQKKNSSISAKKREQKKRDLKLLNDPLEKRICVICGGEFTVNKSSEKVTCKNNCTFKHRYKLGLIKLNNNSKKSYASRIIKTLSEFKDMILNIENVNNFIFLIEDLKRENKISKLFGMSSDTIKKYFDDFETLKNNIKNYESIKNTKTKKV